MDIDFEEYISQSIITNDEENVSVETKQIKDYKYLINEICFDVAVEDDFTVSDEEESLMSLKQKMSEHFACERCRQAFDTKSEFNQHVDTQECHRKYKTKAELKEISDGYAAQILEINYATDDDDDDEVDHEKETSANGDKSDMLQCEECGESCDGEKSLRKHWMSHGRRQCKKCSNWFYNVKEFEEHMQEYVRKEQSKLLLAKRKEQLELESKKNDGKFLCMDCGRLCASKAGLVRHMASHKPRRSRNS